MHLVRQSAFEVDVAARLVCLKVLRKVLHDVQTIELRLPLVFCLICELRLGLSLLLVTDFLPLLGWLDVSLCPAHYRIVLRWR